MIQFKFNKLNQKQILIKKKVNYFNIILIKTKAIGQCKLTFS